MCHSTHLEIRAQLSGVGLVDFYVGIGSIEIAKLVQQVSFPGESSLQPGF